MAALDKQPLREQRGQEKLSRIPIKVKQTVKLEKPSWLKIKAPSGNQVANLKKLLRANTLNTVCEQASCPNLGECFSNGTATFMIMGNFCTRRCPFCDVAHGRPEPLDETEPEKVAEAVAAMKLRYVVVTSVDRDDLRDGGASHFSRCVNAIRAGSSSVKVEILVPDFRGRMEKALDGISRGIPDVFNHNMETVNRLYKEVRPGSDYKWSLDLIKNFKEMFPDIPTKSGLMLGLGEELDEVFAAMEDLKNNGCDMVTIGQYLQPSRYHLSVKRYVTPSEFFRLKQFGEDLGFTNVASGPLVRSSYHADEQAKKKINQHPQP